VGAAGVNERVGAAYVCEQSKDGSWGLLADITPSDAPMCFGLTTGVGHSRHGMTKVRSIFTFFLILRRRSPSTVARDQGTTCISLDIFRNTIIIGARSGDEHVLVYVFNQGNWDVLVDLSSPQTYSPAVHQVLQWMAVALCSEPWFMPRILVEHLCMA